MRGFDQPAIGLRYYWRQVRKRSWLIIAMVLVSLTLGALYIARTPLVYQATATLLIERVTPKVAPFEDIVVSGSTVVAANPNAYYQTQQGILRSRSLAWRVIHTLDLRNHREFALGQPTKEGVQTLEPQQPDGPEASEAHTPAKQPQDAAPPAPPDTALVNAFLSRLTIGSRPDSNLVSVSFKTRDPSLAAEVINTLVRLYIDFNLEHRFASVHEALAWLNEQVSSMRQRVETSELALQHHKDQRDLHLLEDRLASVRQELANLNTSLTRTTTERIELETLYHETQRATQQGQAVEWTPAVMGNTLIQALKGRYAELLQQFAQLSQQYNAKHHRIIELQAQLDALQAKIDTEVKKIVQAMYTQYQVARARERALMARMEALKQEVKTLNKEAIEYDVLKRDAESNRRLSELLLTRMKEVNLSTNLTSGNTVRIIDPAEMPRQPINTRPVWILLTAGVIGLTLGVSLATCLGYFDNTLKTPDEAEKLLGFPVVGALEQYAHGGKISSEPQALEAFRRLRANLLCNHTEYPRKVFLVTSPHPKEGKTTIATNLAVIMALMERRVLFVEADLRSAPNNLTERFPITTPMGLSELLLTEKYEDTISACRGNLVIVPAGECPPNPSELLGSRRMQHFIEFARQHYDVVIIDSLPLLAVSDAMVLSELVDSILVVLRAGLTPYDHARHTIAQLLGLQTPSPLAGEQQKASSTNTNLGLVINFLDPRERSTYGYSAGRVPLLNG
jgi:capsular exopolysaccharide synthesis family protein